MNLKRNQNRILGALCGLVVLTVSPFVLHADENPAPLRVPAFTAYSEPGMEDVEVAPERGLTGWTNAKDHIAWYGNIVTPGTLNVSVSLRLSAQAVSRLRLTVVPQPSGDRGAAKKKAAGVTRRAEGGAKGGLTTVDFGQVNIPAPGYYRFALEGIAKNQATFGNVDALLLSGQAAQNAHFNLRPEQRGAPSVHLSYPISKDAEVEWFYNEVTAKTDPLWSYYMACGWHRGYFGMQVNSATERRIIFSVWDSGKEAVDRNKVSDDNKVKLLAKGNGVFAESFGNEGTGGHSHLVYNWKTGDTYRFLVSAQPDGTATVYTGWFFFPEAQKWGLIARFRAPKDGSYLRGLYSFDEDWNSPNGQMKRLAEFGPQWIKTSDGIWTELTTATFTHTGKDSRTDYDAGTRGDRFYLTGGGFTDGKVKYRDSVQRPPSGKPPIDVVLPEN